MPSMEKQCIVSQLLNVFSHSDICHISVLVIPHPFVSGYVVPTRT